MYTQLSKKLVKEKVVEEPRSNLQIGSDIKERTSESINTRLV